MRVLYLHCCTGERDGRCRGGYGHWNRPEPLRRNRRDESAGQIKAAYENYCKGECKLGPKRGAATTKASQPGASF